MLSIKNYIYRATTVASEYGHLEIVKYLIEQAAQVDERTVGNCKVSN